MVKAAISRLAKGSLIYGVGGILQRFIGLLLLPFFTRVLTPEDYGVVALLTLVTAAMGGVFNLGAGNAMGILYYRENNHSQRPTIIWTCVALMTLNALWLYMLLYLSAPLLSSLMFQSSKYADFIRLALLGLVFSNIAEPWLSYLRMEARAKQYVIITLAGSLITIILSIWLVLVLRMGVIGMLLAGTIGQGLLLFVCWFSIGRTLPFSINRKQFGPLIRIGFPSIFGLFAFMVIDYADRQMIERLVGLDALGVYSVGYSFGFVMMIPVGAFSTAWPPFFMSYINKKEEACIVFSRVMSYYLLGFGALLLLFFYAAKPVVLLLTASPFHEAFLIVGLVAAAYALKGCYIIALPGVYFAHKLHFQSAVEWIAAVINIGLNLLLIPLYGILGAAIATFVSYLSLPVMAYFVSRRYLNVDYQWSRITKTGGLIFLACFLMDRVSTWDSLSLVSVILVNTIILLLFAAAMFSFLLTGSERNNLKSIIQI